MEKQTSAICISCKDGRERRWKLLSLSFPIQNYKSLQRIIQVEILKKYVLFLFLLIAQSINSPVFAAEDEPPLNEPLPEATDDLAPPEPPAPIDQEDHAPTPPGGGKKSPSPLKGGAPGNKAASSDHGPAKNAAGEDKGAVQVTPGKELVNMDFPELTDIKDIIKAIALWTGKNVILDRNVSGKVQIISPRKVTKEEAYQAFLSALNVLGLTTVETGKIIKIMKVRTAAKDNIHTYIGTSYSPRTDEVITQIIPLKYIEAKQIQSTLSKIVSSNSMVAYEPTNTLIVSDTGYKIRKILEMLSLLDVQAQQPRVLIVPIKYSDPKTLVDKVNEILLGGSKGKKTGTFNSFRLMTDERTNSIIIFGTPRIIKDVRDFVKKFDRPIDDPQSQATIHVRPLDYAEAKKLAGTLSSLASGGAKPGAAGAKKAPPVRSEPVKGKKGEAVAVADLGDGVKITADESSNSLIITGSRGAYDALNTIIRKLDVRRSQIFIEADILDITEDNGFVFGSSIFGGYGNSKGTGTKTITTWEAGKMAPLIVASSGVVQQAGGATTTTAQNVAAAFKDNMSIGILSGQSINIPGLGEFTPGALINLVKSDSNSRVMASPHILTSNNEDATISVGETLFFKSSSTNAQTGAAIPKLEKENVDMTLNIKPSISHSNYVTITMELDSNTVKGLTDEGIPRLNKRKTKQIVTVKNGQTVVISGLVNNSEFETYKKIPLLGDIPILGWIFRNTQKEHKASNLVIFMTPHIVHGAEDLAAIYKNKVKERNEFLENIYGSSYASSDFYKKLPTEENGQYKPTAMDDAEEKRLQTQKQEAMKALGYEEGDKEGPEEKNTTEEEIETSLPVPFDSEGVGSTAMSTPPPPPPVLVEPESAGGGESMEEAPSPPSPVPEASGGNEEGESK